VPEFLKKWSRFEIYVSFILIDADNFKKYNDNYGHLKGDDVLKAIAKKVKETFKRDNDFCYRVGGEEFLVVSSSDNIDNGLDMARKLCKNIEDLNIEHKYNADFGKITASIGVSTKKVTHSLKIEQLYNEADKALYKSKENGRNQVTKYIETRKNYEN
jgi:diguanylate cyclase (GGDEF)-like protein